MAVMIRRLIACFAILTGLAAANAPAHAAIVGAVEAQLEQAQSTDEPSVTVDDPCILKQRKQRLRGEIVTPCRPAQRIVITVPTVQFGSDRAYE